MSILESLSKQNKKIKELEDKHNAEIELFILASYVYDHSNVWLEFFSNDEEVSDQLRGYNSSSMQSLQKYLGNKPSPKLAQNISSKLLKSVDVIKFLEYNDRLSTISEELEFGEKDEPEAQGLIREAYRLKGLMLNLKNSILGTCDQSSRDDQCISKLLESYNLSF